MLELDVLFWIWIAEHAILALGKQHIMKDVFGDVAKEIPQNLFELVGKIPMSRKWIFMS
jgi:hypothetical protein